MADTNIYIYEDGVKRAMTEEEKAEYIASLQERPPEPTIEERIAALEEQLREAKASIETE